MSRGAKHLGLSTALTVFFLGSSAASQSLLPKPPAVQHISVESGASVPAASPGGVVTLWADVTPNVNVHVYAEGAGAFDFTPVSMVLTPHQAVSAGKPRFPPAQRAPKGGADEHVPIYTKAFRIAQPITLLPAAKRGEVLTISGAVNYQACDDRVCYPPSSVPIRWTVTVR